MRLRLLSAICLIVLLASSIFAQQPQVPNYYIPYHVYDTQTKQWIDLESMLAAASKNDVLFLGEQHNDTFGHQLELAIVQGTARRRANLVIAMEMFERDAQPALNDYLGGRINEMEFLSRSRPWPNYQSDYRPIIEFARSRNLTVIGSNAPQRLARAVAQNGISIVEKFPTPDRALVAMQIESPRDQYWQRFVATMTAMVGHGHGGAAASAANPHSNANPHGGSNGAATAPPDVSERIEKFYQAQVLKDETMAESIVNVLKERESSKPIVIHINGDFHSAYREGTAARTRRRLPSAGIKHVSFIPVSNLDSIKVDEYIDQGDYLIFTLQPDRE
jgi:uncharacterized iron-regulated protein